MDSESVPKDQTSAALQSLAFNTNRLTLTVSRQEVFQERSTWLGILCSVLRFPLEWQVRNPKSKSESQHKLAVTNLDREFVVPLERHQQVSASWKPLLFKNSNLPRSQCSSPSIYQVSFNGNCYITCRCDIPLVISFAIFNMFQSFSSILFFCINFCKLPPFTNYQSVLTSSSLTSITIHVGYFGSVHTPKIAHTFLCGLKCLWCQPVLKIAPYFTVSASLRKFFLSSSLECSSWSLFTTQSQLRQIPL